MEAIFTILAMYFIADFALQDRYMGENKSRNPLGDGPVYIFFAVINGIMHVTVDFVSSKLSALAYKKKQMDWFWNIIRMDQFVHIVTLLAIHDAMT